MVAPSGSAKEVVPLDTCSSLSVTAILSGSAAIEDAVEKASTCTFHIALKNSTYPVHFENNATEPPIIT